MTLLPSFVRVVQGWHKCFSDYRTHRRAMGFALALLVTLGRRTISRAICAQQRQYQSWSSDYRFFSTSCWNPRQLFDVARQEACRLMWDRQPLVVAMDDTILRKTGTRIPWARTLRDPLSPRFNTNLTWALRFLHAALLIWPPQAKGAARAIPIAFELAPPVAKPKRPRHRKDDSIQKRMYDRAEYVKAMQEYRRKQKEEGLSAQGARLLADLHSRFSTDPGRRQQKLWAVVDASFCNRTVFNKLAAGIILIGRTRKDIRLYAPPQKQDRKGKGRNRKYGKPLPTPEQLRQDASVPWQHQSIFAAGKKHSLHYKTLAPVLWKIGSGARPMRLIVIRPLSYRAHGHTLYRRPAYLLISDPEVDVAQALQAYFYRWEIEVDQKEEKDLLGVGQAQVWSQGAVPRQPAFHVASYAALLVAALKVYGMNTAAASEPLPLWRRNKPPTRLSAALLIAQLRAELDECPTSLTSKTHHLRHRKNQFRTDALQEQIGMKIPVTLRAIVRNAWS
jgi:hypothetical protein